MIDIHALLKVDYLHFKSNRRILGGCIMINTQTNLYQQRLQLTPAKLLPLFIIFQNVNSFDVAVKENSKERFALFEESILTAGSRIY
jgi:hypothetical protein